MGSPAGCRTSTTPRLAVTAASCRTVPMRPLAGAPCRSGGAAAADRVLDGGFQQEGLASQALGDLEHLAGGLAGLLGGVVHPADVGGGGARADRGAVDVAGDLLRRGALLLDGSRNRGGSSTTWPIAWIDSTALRVAPCIVLIWVAISPVARAIWLARLFTSVATTAKPLPASPARAASMTAFSASRLVCAAMLLMRPPRDRLGIVRRVTQMALQPGRETGMLRDDQPARSVRWRRSMADMDLDAADRDHPGTARTGRRRRAARGARRGRAAHRASPG